MSKEVDVSKLSDFEISILVIERDTAQFKASRIDELLNEYGRAKGFVDAEKKETTTKSYDVEKIHWVEKTGAKGPYEHADPKTEGGKPDFQALLADLKGHDSKFRHGGLFYWVFNDAASIGRKKLAK